MVNRRMLAAVPRADLVVMNPTHYAVALKYDEAKMAAPRVVAKGADLLALRIRDLARDAKVPVLQAPPLARALYAHTEVDQEIPARLFGAVAQVLAWVYQLRDAMAAGRPLPGRAPAARGARRHGPAATRAARRRRRRGLTVERARRRTQRAARPAGQRPRRRHEGAAAARLRGHDAGDDGAAAAALRAGPAVHLQHRAGADGDDGRGADGQAAGLRGPAHRAAGHHAAAAVAERGVHARGADGRPHRAGRGRAR